MFSIFVLFFCFIFTLAGANLPGECPQMKIQENLDYTKHFANVSNTVYNLVFAGNSFYRISSRQFTDRINSMVASYWVIEEHFSGVWYNVASYASDGRSFYDCSSFEFQEDNLGYTLREQYVDLDEGNRTHKSYFARVDPTFDAGNKAQFIVSYEDGDKILQFPFFILATDYDGYAIAYTCKTFKTKIRTHYVFSWILTRSNEKLQGDVLKNVENTLSKYSELAEQRQSFVFKEFDDKSCGYTNEIRTDFFTSNFW